MNIKARFALWILNINVFINRPLIFFVNLSIKDALRAQIFCGSYFLNLFVKPNEQKKACFHFAMARKGARKRTLLNGILVT